MAEHVWLDMVDPRIGCGFPVPDVLCKRDDLLPDKNSQQADKSDDGRRGRADIEQTVDDTDQKPGAKRQKIDLHGNLLN
jgi:hypothetical protein